MALSTVALKPSFPEGVAWCGRVVVPFKKNFLHMLMRVREKHLLFRCELRVKLPPEVENLKDGEILLNFMGEVIWGPLQLLLGRRA